MNMGSRMANNIKKRDNILSVLNFIREWVYKSLKLLKKFEFIYISKLYQFYTSINLISGESFLIYRYHENFWRVSDNWRLIWCFASKLSCIDSKTQEGQYNLWNACITVTIAGGGRQYNSFRRYLAVFRPYE